MTVRALKIKGEQISFLAHADSAEQLITGATTGETPTGWNFKVYRTYVYWVDYAGAGRRAEGTLTGGRRTYRSTTVHGELLYYGDNTGAERSLSAAVPVEVEVEIGALRDSWIDTYYASQNFGTSGEINVGEYFGWQFPKSLISFDISAIPSGATITEAILRLVINRVGTTGNHHWAYKLLHDDWVESEVTFEEKSSGVAWTSGDFSASDYTTDNGVSALVPSSPLDYVTWDIAAIVQAALDGSINVNLAIIQAAEETNYSTYFTKEMASAYRPKLTVTYTE